MIYHGNVLDVLENMASESVQCVITSPPYWGLRDYGLEPQVWGGDKNCKHEWLSSVTPGGQTNGLSFRRDKKGGRKRGVHQPGFCRKCGAWCGSLGLEPTPELYVEHLVQIFSEVKRVLKNDGVLWLNLGDSYVNHFIPSGGDPSIKIRNIGASSYTPTFVAGLKPKNLIGIPWHTAFALQTNGWCLRQDIIWQKKNAMPESVKDRCTKAHEYIFLLSKNTRYYYDAEAIKEGRTSNEDSRIFRGGCYINGRIDNDLMGKRQVAGNKKIKIPSGWDTAPGAHGNFHRAGRRNSQYVTHGKWSKEHPQSSGRRMFENTRQARLNAGADHDNPFGTRRNKRSVWTVEDHELLLKWLIREHPETAEEFFNTGKSDVWAISTKAYKEAHFSTFPPDLIKPCILAGTKPGDTVLDPFGGTMTTAYVAREFYRKAAMIELNERYIQMGINRLQQRVLPFEPLNVSS